MDNQVEEIKRKLDVVSVIGRYLPLKKRGRHFLANCPFHQEKTPSFTVSPELQIFKCFGCGKGGDIFTFVQEFEKVEFPEALEILAKLAGITLKKSPRFSDQTNQNKLLVGINQQMAIFYHYILTSHQMGKSALDYVLKRGISLATIKTFQLGFSPKNSQFLINLLRKKGYKDNQLIATGTIGRSQYHTNQLYDRFSDRLIFPLVDHRDRLVAFSGRVLPGAAKNQAKYINSPETALYHKSHMVYGLNLAKTHIRDKNSVIVTEGEFDMISPYQAGVKNIIAIKGTAFTVEQLRLLRRYTDTIILALDADFAGQKAAQTSIKLADDLEFDLKVLSLGNKYKDPDEAVQADPDFFHQQLKKTLPIWDFLIQSACHHYDTATIKGKKTVLSTVLPFLVKINNSVIRSDYFKKLADAISSTTESVFQEANKYQKDSHSSSSSTSSSSTPSSSTSSSSTPLTLSRDHQLQQALLTLILGASNPAKLTISLKKKSKIVTAPQYKKLISALEKTKKFTPQKFQQRLPAESRETFQTLFVQATSVTIEPPRRLFEIEKIIDQIQITRLKDKLSSLSQQIGQLESSGKQDSLLKLESRHQRLLSKLSQLQIKK